MVNLISVLIGCCTSTTDAAWKGHITCMRRLHKQGASWGCNTCMMAAQRGNLDCLRYAHKCGAHMGGRTCMIAAEYGQIACLRYAHEHGAPIWIPAYWSALGHGHVQCARYAYMYSDDRVTADPTGKDPPGQSECRPDLERSTRADGMVRAFAKNRNRHHAHRAAQPCSSRSHHHPALLARPPLRPRRPWACACPGAVADLSKMNVPLNFV